MSAPLSAPALPSLADVPEGYRRQFSTGYFIFWRGVFMGWRCFLRAREWQAGAVAVAADGTPGLQITVGGSVMSGAEKWEAVAP